VGKQAIIWTRRWRHHRSRTWLPTTSRPCVRTFSTSSYLVRPSTAGQASVHLRDVARPDLPRRAERISPHHHRFSQPRHLKPSLGSRSRDTEQMGSGGKGEMKGARTPGTRREGRWRRRAPGRRMRRTPSPVLAAFLVELEPLLLSLWSRRTATD
jgi:hypothetical protein